MTQENAQRPCWFVGAAYGGRDDKTQEFISQGIWSTGHSKPEINDLVKSVQPGDRIAIKANFTQKNSLPFDNKKQTISGMRIKAIGTVLQNPGDGVNLKVEWHPVADKKDWYLFTYRSTISPVYPASPEAKALIAFTFEDTAQDFDFFLGLPKWQERFTPTPSRFLWTSFYMEFADALLQYKTDRAPLLAKILELSVGLPLASYIKDVHSNGIGPLEDICPFTVMGIFNRGLTEGNRIAIASELASFLGVSSPVPQAFDGIPVMNNQRSWFFRYAKERAPDDIPALWTFFETALKLASPEAEDSDEEYDTAQTAFIAAYDTVSAQPFVSWNLTMGLYWIRPWFFPSLDTLSRVFIPARFPAVRIPATLKRAGSGATYLQLKEQLENAFGSESTVTSFPALSLAAWENSGYAQAVQTDEEGPLPENPESAAPSTAANEPGEAVPYSIDSIVNEDCFLAKAELEKMLDALKKKKNLILQGPPGTGKTWLAKRLAQALIGYKGTEQIRSLQFHATLSYEDFVRGWRPAGGGRLELCDGPFLELINMAMLPGNETKPFVMVIEEINRGNPAQIFGELLTLLEADKRTAEHALRLCYQKEGECRELFIPPNIYLIGTMNVADRSLALVDFALRRRFAFFTLEPCFNDIWATVLHEKYEVPQEMVRIIRAKMTTLNKTIADDPTLRAQYAVGHSYVTPREKVENAGQWFRDVIESEIAPLLQEYWFDNNDKLLGTVTELKRDM